MGRENRENPLFSVVIPLYNKADTIERTIQSVQSQTFRDFELIIVNDGSTDNSLAVVERLSAEISIRIVDKKNGGVSSARNMGVKIAKGKYIALLDGDDVWLPGHLSMMAGAIKKYPDVKFFGGGYKRHTGAWIYFTIPWGNCRIKDVYSTFRWGQPINSSTVVIEKELWEKVGGFDERYSFYEDYEFFFRIGLHTECCVVNKHSGVYMFDAAEQATKKKRVINRDTRPHIAFVDNCIREGTETRPMVKFAVTQLSVILCGATGFSEVDKIRCMYPYVFNASLLLKALCVRNIGIHSILVVVFKLVYKFQCHLIIWRKHA